MTSDNSYLPQVAVYTITYNQCSVLEHTIGDLCSQDYPRNLLQVVVLNDGSTDGTASFLTSIVDRVSLPLKILHSQHEADYLSARRWNQCIAATSDSVQVFIQIDDVRLRPDFIRQHVKWYSNGGDFVVTGAKFEGAKENWELSSCRRAALAGPLGAAATVDTFTAIWGASLSFNRRLMEAVIEEPYDLPYDERMQGWGYQEVELAFRMQRAGGQLIYDPAAGVFHKDHTTVSEAKRGLERARLVATGEVANARYLMDKHGLEELPWW